MSKRVGSESSRPSKRPKNDPPQPRAVGWSRNDQIRLDATKGPEWTTWKRFENLMSQDPLTFLKDFTIEARPEKDLDGVDGDTIANPNWTDKFCSALSQLACVPAFWKNPDLFHYSLRSAISCRTGGKAPDNQTIPRSNSPHKAFVKMIPKAIEDLKQSRGRHRVEDPKALHLADLLALIKAWDLYARSAPLLRMELKTIKGYTDECPKFADKDSSLKAKKKDTILALRKTLGQRYYKGLVIPETIEDPEVESGEDTESDARFGQVGQDIGPEDDNPKSDDLVLNDTEPDDPESEDNDLDTEDHRPDEPGLEDYSMPVHMPLDLDNREDFRESSYDKDWDLNDYPEV